MSYANPYELIDRRLSAIEQVLQELRQQRNPITPDEIGGIELARQVTRLSAARIYTLVSERRLPHKKRGNRLTFRRSELLEWLDEGNRETTGGPDA
ncbi:helix-turn-helix domain-containing protein [Spirosoma jeollabukense]